MVAAYKTFASKDITGRFDEELVKQLPESWKFICNNGMCDARTHRGKRGAKRPSCRTSYDSSPPRPTIPFPPLPSTNPTHLTPRPPP